MKHSTSSNVSVLFVNQVKWFNGQVYLANQALVFPEVYSMFIWSPVIYHDISHPFLPH